MLLVSGRSLLMTPWSTAKPVDKGFFVRRWEIAAN